MGRASRFFVNCKKGQRKKRINGQRKKRINGQRKKSGHVSPCLGLGLGLWVREDQDDQDQDDQDQDDQDQDDQDQDDPD